MPSLRHSLLTFGPSLAADLQMAILITLTTAARLQTIYHNETFSKNGDYIFLLLVFLWKSRSAWIKLICLSDTSTCKNPTIQGIIATFITLHLMGGQTIDQPIDVHAPNASLIPYSVTYTMHWLRVRVWLPIKIAWESDQHSSQRYRKPIYASNRTKTTKNNTAMRFLGPPLRAIQSFLIEYGFTLQFLIPVFALIYIFTQMFIEEFGHNKQEDLAFKMLRSAIYRQEDIQKGNYEYQKNPSWLEIIYELFSKGTLLSLACFVRVIPPFPDLIAGSFDTSTKTQPGKLRKKQVWTERFNSIVYMLRFKVATLMFLIHLIENMFIVFAVAPSHFVCRTIGHCKEDMSISKLRHILFPVGVTTPFRKDLGQPMDDYQTTDWLAFLWLLGAIVLINFSYLYIQVLVNQRTYFARAASKNKAARKKRRALARANRQMLSLFDDEIGPPSNSPLLEDGSRLMYLVGKGHIFAYFILILCRSKRADGLLLAGVTYFLSAYFLARPGLVDRSEINTLASEI